MGNILKEKGRFNHQDTKGTKKIFNRLLKSTKKFFSTLLMFKPKVSFYLSWCPWCLGG